MATRQSTTADGPEYKKKNSRGQSHKTIDGPRASDGGGDRENSKVAKHAHKGLRPGTSAADRQAPSKQRSRVVNVDEWCRGKGEYKRPERKPRGLL